MRSQSNFALMIYLNVLNQLALIWAIESLYHAHSDFIDELLRIGEQTLLNVGPVDKDETLVMMAGRLSDLQVSSSVVVSAVVAERCNFWF
jgi:hypothetical protein